MNGIEKNKRIEQNNKQVKPCLKWAGGKGQILKEIIEYYPFEKDNTITKYAEPFVGGGAVFFDILNKFNLEEIYISDANEELINTYQIIRDDINILIDLLSEIQEEYLKLDIDSRKEYYLQKRDQFNKLKGRVKLNTYQSINIKKAALMIFLNKTCFNGLYRVNKQGFYNVPMGKYKNPIICDEENLRNISNRIQRVKIICGDYKESQDFIDKHTFVYFDPPYRPITKTSSFTAYTHNLFTDKQQLELAEFIGQINKIGAKFLISNSDPKNINPNDNFFDKIYNKYNIKRVEAIRSINSDKNGRGKLFELLISN